MARWWHDVDPVYLPAAVFLISAHGRPDVMSTRERRCSRCVCRHSRNRCNSVSMIRALVQAQNRRRYHDSAGPDRKAIDDRAVLFDFGDNWKQSLGGLTEVRIHQAERSLGTSLGLETLRGKTFLDVASGSGLFSLAARRLGTHVHSFDFKTRSIACTAELKERYFARSLE